MDRVLRLSLGPHLSNEQRRRDVDARGHGTARHPDRHALSRRHDAVGRHGCRRVPAERHGVGARRQRHAVRDRDRLHAHRGRTIPRFDARPRRVRARADGERRRAPTLRRALKPEWGGQPARGSPAARGGRGVPPLPPLVPPRPCLGVGDVATAWPSQGEAAAAWPPHSNGMAENEEAVEQEAEERSAPTGAVVYHAICSEGESELERPSSALAWSALAAGMSMSMSFVAQALVHASLPETIWRPLIVAAAYPVGFIIVILGR